MRLPPELRRSVLASAIGLLCASPASTFATDITVAPVSPKSNGASVGGVDHLTVEANAQWVADDTVIKWKDASTALVIDNSGLIESTEDDGRAINASGDDTASRSLTLNNYQGGVIRSQNDAFRINIDITGGKVVVNNAGTIISTVDGQALDFDALTSTTAGSVRIDNLVGGLIQANAADAIRPGEAGTVVNKGTIYSDGILGDSNDAIDFQAHGGTVINQAGGLISGQRHGITGSGNLDVYNAAGATIIGRNGSGVGSDGTGNVVNYGTITGAYVGTGNGDGDGVDIDYYGTVDNYGVIQGTGAGGVGKDGDINASEGIAISGGGYIKNHAGAVVSGIVNGITAYGAMSVVDGGVRYGEFSIENEGLVTGEFKGIAMTGDTSLVNSGTITSTNIAVSADGGDAYVQNSGVISGANGAIIFGAGDDTLVIDSGSVIQGEVDGGAGNDTLWLRGGTFDVASSFEQLRVTNDATLVGDNSFSNVAVEGILRLGNGGTTGSFGTGPVRDDGLIYVNHAGDLTLASSISGAGGLTQAGTGDTTLTAANTYTGLTTVQAGTLTLAPGSAIGGDVTVATSAVLAGNGKVGGNLSVAPGGTVRTDANGDMAALHVGGDVTFAGGSVIDTTIPVDGKAILTVDGHLKADTGSSIALSASEPFTIGGTSTLMHASNGLTGQFQIKGAGNGFSFVSPRLIYLQNDVLLQLDRNAVSLASVATTVDDRNVGAAIDGMAISGAIPQAIYQLSIDDARAALSDLSGQGYASARTGMLADARQARDAIDRHLKGMAGIRDTSGSRDGVSAWISSWGNAGRNDSDTASRLDRNGAGVLVGADIGIGGSARLGAVAGHGISHDDVDAERTSTRESGTYAGLYGDLPLDHLVVRAGLVQNSMQVSATRRLTAIAAGTQLASHYDARLTQLFMEAGHPLIFNDRQMLEPFIGLAHVRLDTGSASEGDREGALVVAGGRTSIDTARAGLHGAWDLWNGRVSMHGQVAYEVSSGDVAGETHARFSDSGSSFTVNGVPLARHMTTTDIGIALGLTGRARLDVSYLGQFGPGQPSQGGMATLSVNL